MSRSDWKPFIHWVKAISATSAHLHALRDYLLALIVVERFPEAAPHTLPERQDVVPN